MGNASAAFPSSSQPDNWIKSEETGPGDETMYCHVSLVCSLVGEFGPAFSPCACSIWPFQWNDLAGKA